ncbi:MAG: hypothetical protein IKR25_10305 [Muribaculaceae bacterium]|nr:hypothetical protein [Muribaculaceae bacterium]
MKKLSLLLATVLCVLASSATDYKGRMTVTGTTGQAVKDDALVTITQNANGTYKATMHDFIIVYNGVSYPLPELEYDNLTGTVGTDGYTTVRGTQYMTVKDIEGYESFIPEQYRSYLGYVTDKQFPVNFNGKFSASNMTAHIDTYILVEAEPYPGYVMTYCNTPMDIDFNGKVVEEYIRGDVNGSGVVDVEDMNIIVNIILKKDSDTNYGERAHVVGGTSVSISDLNAVINIMLGKD